MRWWMGWPVVAMALAGCGAPQGGHLAGAPAFMRGGYEGFSREAAVAVALREWRAWGSPVRDEAPGSRPEPAEWEKAERQEGYWQRVGEYWWTTLGATQAAGGWTGRHDGAGRVFDAARDGDFAWSAAFIRYVLASAGAGEGLPPGVSHASFIQAAAVAPARVRMRAHGLEYPPKPGDLVCHGRGGGPVPRIGALPAGSFPAHCDIVVAVGSEEISVVGGNVGDAVSLKHVPVDETGRLADARGVPYDARYPWFAVMEVLYVR
jgi:hypothetical protein